MNPQESFELGPGRFDPPPLPRQIPVPAIPVSQAPPSHRPAIVTTMAVISILVAVVGIGAYLIMGLQSLSILSTKPPPPPVPPSPPPSFLSALFGGLTTQPAPPPVQGASSVALDGLDRAETDVAVQALDSGTGNSTFDLAERQQLQHFLALHGRRVFPRTEGPVTADRVMSDVQSSNAQTSEGGPGHDPGHVNYFLKNGKLTVYHDRASFLEEGSDQPLVTTVATPPPSGARPGGASGYGALTADEARQVVAAINQQVGNKLNPTQAQTLMRELQSPQQHLLEPSYIPTPLDNAAVLSDGTAMIHFSCGTSMEIHRDGKLPGEDLLATIAGKKWTLTHARPYARIAGYCATFGLILAMMLFASAIEVFRQERLGLQLHLAWALFMIPLALASLAWAWIEAHQLFGQPLGNSIARDPLTIFLVIGGGVLLLTLIYPIVVLLILRKPAVRDYYNSLI